MPVVHVKSIQLKMYPFQEKTLSETSVPGFIFSGYKNSFEKKKEIIQEYV